ncbi:hypothetical protein NPIL_257611 [Nephila pilipes]|uniref:Protein kinase domain-containing protein n=1 Tax=Nephila pilipes TaxID=299642 RepID=A0A8X6R736_NEPPI|nr:hypothetical protein NPIL_257611 [Nephila pilipes]
MDSQQENEEDNSFVTNTNKNTTYKICTPLGAGTFARCFEFQNTVTGERFAAKVIPKSETQERNYGIFQEIIIHSTLSHPSIIKFYDHFEDEGHMYLILELCRPITLGDMLKRRKVLIVPEVRYILLKLIEACKYLHQKHVIHCDLKLENILINDKMEIKVADFGLSRRLDEGTKIKGIRGTLPFMAPEILLDVGYDYKVDIWALGCIIFTLLTGSQPFKYDKDRNVTIKKIIEGKYHIPDNVESSARNMIKKLLEVNPDVRPGCPEILKDYFLKQELIPSRLPKTCLTKQPKCKKVLPEVTN